MHTRQQSTRVRDTTGNLQRVAIPNPNTEKWIAMMRQKSNYWKVFTSGPIGDLTGFYEGAEVTVEFAIQSALEALEEENGSEDARCLMNIVDMKFEIAYYLEDDMQVFHVVGYILAVPMPHEKPSKGPKRLYQRAKR